MHANTRFGWSFVPHHALRYRTNAEFIAESLSLAQHFGRRKVFRSRSIRVFARTFIFISFALSLVSVDGRRVSIPLAIYRFNLMLLQIVHAFGGDRRAKCTKLVDERWLMLGSLDAKWNTIPCHFGKNILLHDFDPGRMNERGIYVGGAGTDWHVAHTYLISLARIKLGVKISR